MSDKFDSEHRFEETELFRTHFRKIPENIGKKWAEHLGLEGRVYHYSHSEVIEFGLETTQAPCIILTGPAIDPSGDLSHGVVTVQVGGNESGKVKTRQYENIPHIDMTYDITIVAMNPLDLMQYVISSVQLFRTNAFVNVDNKRYKMWRILYPSTAHVINHTNSSMARGRFQLRGVPVLVPFDVLQSGIIYNNNLTTQKFDEIPADC